MCGRWVLSTQRFPGWAALRGSAAQWGPAKLAEPARPTAQLAASPAAQPPEWAPEAEKPEGHHDHDAGPAPRQARLTGRLLGKSEPGAGSGSGASAARRGHPGLKWQGACTWGGGAFTGQRPRAGRRWQHACGAGVLQDTIPPRGSRAHYVPGGQRPICKLNCRSRKPTLRQ